MGKALLVVSFGTSFRETREKTICALEEDLRKTFQDRKFYRAWTSNRIIKKVAVTEGLRVDTIEEAVLHMKGDGITDVLVQPTHMMNGYENDRLMKLLRNVRGGFDRITYGKPMLASQEDLDYMSETVMSEYGEVKAGGAALVLMGHGAPTLGSEANGIYVSQEGSFRKLGYDKVFVGTVEAEPSLEDVIRELSERYPTPGKVYIAPFLIVAGDHATNDMAGDSPDSWKNRLAAMGYDVVPVIKGLGEYGAVRRRFVEHALGAEEL